MEAWFIVAGGGALGALGRYWTGIACGALFGKAFPVGTLLVNVLGSFLIGLTAAAVHAHLLSESPWSDFVMQGFCGALTTFSTFSMDSFRLCRQGSRAKAVLNVVLSMVLCLSAAWLGLDFFVLTGGAI